MKIKAKVKEIIPSLNSSDLVDQDSASSSVTVCPVWDTASGRSSMALAAV